jgi:hypothetical protein
MHDGDSPEHRQPALRVDERHGRGVLIAMHARGNNGCLERCQHDATESRPLQQAHARVHYSLGERWQRAAVACPKCRHVQPCPYVDAWASVAAMRRNGGHAAKGASQVVAMQVTMRAQLDGSTRQVVHMRRQ